MEHEPKSAERSGEQLQNQAELAELAAEQAEHLPEAAESGAERAKKVEAARMEIQQHAQEEAPPAEKEAPAQHTPTKFDKLAAYGETVKSLQRKLSPSGRTFSKVIHAPAVEKASEALENTVMRPSVTLGATISAALFGGVFYFTARYYGFRLSGSEFIISIILGGFVGAAIEGIGKLFRSKKTD